MIQCTVSLEGGRVCCLFTEVRNRGGHLALGAPAVEFQRWLFCGEVVWGGGYEIMGKPQRGERERGGLQSLKKQPATRAYVPGETKARSATTCTHRFKGELTALARAGGYVLHARIQGRLAYCTPSNPSYSREPCW